MCAGIFADSFYSKIERGVNNVGILRLITLLNSHNVSLYDFFNPLDEENLPELKLRKQIHSAFNNRDLDQLQKIQESLNDKKSIEYLQINLMLATLKGQTYEVPEEIQQKMKAEALKEDLKQQKDFWDLAMFSSLYGLIELKNVITFIMKNSSALDLTNDSLLTSLLNLIINYLDRCYREKHVYDVQKLSTFVNQIADEYPIIFHKLIVKYYVALLEKMKLWLKKLRICCVRADIKVMWQPYQRLSKRIKKCY